MFMLEDRNLERNEASLASSVPLDELPKTFQDAIQITKCLGIRYLWIDSLCIIQDSTQDWGKEAAAMSQVYKNAYWYIAATSASDSSVERFFARATSMASATIITLEWSEANKKPFAVAQPHQDLMPS
jgi:hypothetical protein